MLSRYRSGSESAGSQRFGSAANIFQKGFSMVELLVILGILGALTVVSMPQYQKYLRASSIKILSADLKSVARATLSCAAAEEFSKCDSFQDLKIEFSGHSISTVKGSKVCHRVLRDIAGNISVSCVGIDMDEGSYNIIFGMRTCFKEVVDPVTMQTTRTFPSSPLHCRRFGSPSPDCPPDYPRCHPAVQGKCSGSGVCYLNP